MSPRRALRETTVEVCSASANYTFDLTLRAVFRGSVAVKLHNIGKHQYFSLKRTKKIKKTKELRKIYDGQSTELIDLAQPESSNPLSIYR
jgi:hypothetical protein